MVFFFIWNGLIYNKKAKSSLNFGWISHTSWKKWFKTGFATSFSFSSSLLFWMEEKIFLCMLTMMIFFRWKLKDQNHPPTKLKLDKFTKSNHIILKFYITITLFQFKHARRKIKTYLILKNIIFLTEKQALIGFIHEMFRCLHFFLNL